MTSAHDDLERRALDLVERALGVDDAGRNAFVAKAAGKDEALRRRVFAILRGASSEKHSLQTGGALEEVMREATPDEIGGFKIEYEIGRGGMGAVYLARRPGADFDHAVAIKVVRSAASERLLERLRFERRTLAQLKHPNIAQLYDGGETPDGQPYFVMEYAPGAPLHRYLIDSAPTLEQRLDLYRDICDAVAYAHKNLVIHRDLSPSNILITDEGRAKLIDFGIAQSLEDEECDALASKLTMTKGYAAPERADGAPASTITDVYSLGVILREMTDGLSAPRRTDLDAIARKAAAPAPKDRYPTVDALMADIASYREGRAVGAVEKGWLYVLTRFVGRRKFAVGAGAFATLAVVASSLVMSILYVRADAAERRAEQRFDEVRDLAGFIIFDFHDEVAKLEGSTPAREMLAETALNYLDALRNTSDASKSLRLEIAKGYKKLSDVTGNPQVSNLGRLEEAKSLLHIAVEEIRALRHEFPDDAEVARAFAEIIGTQAFLGGASANDFERALSLNEEALAAIASIEAPTEMQLDDQLLIARLNTWHGRYLYRLESYDDAIAQLGSSIALYEEILKANPENADARMGLARASAALGLAVRWRGAVNETGFDAAVPHFDRAVRESGNLAKRDDATLDTKIRYISILLRRANTLCYIDGHEEQGLTDLNDVESLSASLLASDPENDLPIEYITYALLQKIECLYRLGRMDEAADAAEEAIARREASLEKAPENPALLRDLANAYSVVSSLYIELEDWPNACNTARRLDNTWDLYRTVQTKRSEFSAGEDEFNQELLADCAERGFVEL